MPDIKQQKENVGMAFGKGSSLIPSTPAAAQQTPRSRKIEDAILDKYQSQILNTSSTQNYLILFK
ncbi:hypothetical protein [Niveispirillum sp.]|uniref:hypothetical protein n=1 Tax=Niveispirillum sp. TaxID=1917217 RepID=UPI001B4C01E0|nr:hypothetical protein [Niveispirillum sp.]MBP7334714.1 hypothetical protein [Niveispirillum sp.]